MPMSLAPVVANCVCDFGNAYLVGIALGAAGVLLVITTLVLLAKAMPDKAP